MSKRPFLTSALAISLALPVFSSLGNVSSDTMCTGDTFGLSGGTKLRAKWTAQSGSCSEGQYLNAATAQCSDCPAGYYCNGLASYIYDGSDQGITSKCPGGYTSESGAASVSDCFRSIFTPCTNINPYSGPSSDKVLSPVYGNSDGGNTECRIYYGSATCVTQNEKACEITDLNCAIGYHAPVLMDFEPYITANTTNSNAGYLGLNNSSNAEYFGLVNTGTWANEMYFADEYFGIVYGDSKCLAKDGSNGQMDAPYKTLARNSSELNKSGGYCWCQMTGYKESLGSDTISAVSDWVYSGSSYGGDSCAYNCARSCAEQIRYYSSDLFYQGFRYLTFKSADVQKDLRCEINTYTCKPGEYMNGSTGECTVCPAGSYCAGGEYTFNGHDQGIDGQCPSGSYSDAGAVSESDCYRPCSVADVDHATSVSGGWFGNVNMCSAESCAYGWQINMVLDTEAINPANSINSACVNLNGNFSNWTTSRNKEYWGFDASETNVWAIEWQNVGIIRGMASCNNTEKNENGKFPADTFGTQSNGSYCWCKVDGYKQSSGSDVYTLHAPWIYRDSFYDDAECADRCASVCSYEASYNRWYLVSAPKICDKYSCDSGKYLNANGECTVCPAGSYCGGGKWIHNGTTQGIDGTCPDGYTSDAGSSNINNCYRDCELSDVRSATSISNSGKYYYGGTNTCSATACATGWVLKPLGNLDEDVKALSNTGNYTDSNYMSIDANGNVYIEGDRDPGYYGLTQPMTWARNFALDGNGTVYGRASCNTTYINNSIWSNSTDKKSANTFTTDSAGDYCWCQISSYFPGAPKAESDWVAIYDMGSNCASDCARNCTSYFGSITNKLSNTISYPNACVMYSCKAGQYLNSDGECATCPAGYYCNGGEWEHNGTDQGITDICPDGYDSEAGAGSITDCYRSCNIDLIEHATAISDSGKYYYGGANTCNVTQCATGWKLQPKIDLAKEIQDARQSVSGERVNSYYSYIDANGSISNGYDFPASYYNLTEPNTWARDLAGNGKIIYGRASCNSTSGQEYYSGNLSTEPSDTFTTTSSGSYCWCQITGFKPGSNAAIIDTVSDWAYYRSFYGDNNYCASVCVDECKRIITDSDEFTRYLTNSVQTINSCGMYSCGEGYYLNENGECAICPAGSYCAGGEWVHNGSAQGITGTCPSGYTSDEGSFSRNQCFRDCKMSDIDIESALSVSGRVYYNGINTCDAASCATGWEIKETVEITKMNGTNSNPTNSINSACVSLNGDYSNYRGGKSKSYYDFASSDRNVWAVEYTSHGIIKGIASCNDTPKNENGKMIDGTFSQSSTGQYCWCKVTSIKPNDDENFYDLRSDWIYLLSHSNNDSCAYNCAERCAQEASYSRWYLVSAPKVCELKTYHCEAGEYLNAEHEACETCPAGSYCAGGDYKIAQADSSIATCPSGYKSEAGASNCYRDCEPADVANAAAVSGKYYYGDINECDVTVCANGWSIQEKTVFGDTDIASLNTTNSIAIGGGGYYEESKNGGNWHGQSYYGLTQNREWAVDFRSFGAVHGIGICSTTAGNNSYENYSGEPDISSNINDESGQSGATYCWCQINSIKLYGEQNWTFVTSDWMYSTNLGYPEYCNDVCGYRCAGMVDYNTDFRVALFETISTGINICTENNYTCEAGTYLNTDSGECTACPAGSYCAGGTFTYATAESGTTTCPSGYTSDAGASNESQCYIASTASCAIINPDTSDVSMSAVYGNSDNGTATCKTYYGSSTCTLDVANACDITEITCAAGWTAHGGFDLSNANLTFTNNAYGYINAPSEYNNNTASYSTGDAQTVHDQAYYGLTENNTFAVESAEGGIIYGQARCSTTPGDNNGYKWTNPTVLSSLTDETGETGAQYCYCNITGYKADNSSALQSLSSSWVFNRDFGSAAPCASYCAGYCAVHVGNYAGFRSALFGSIESSSLTCTPNTLNIEWYDNGSISAQNTCTYNQTITLPETPAPREGFLFRGWKLVTE